MTEIITKNVEYQIEFIVKIDANTVDEAQLPLIFSVPTF